MEADSIPRCDNIYPPKPHQLRNLNQLWIRTDSVNTANLELFMVPANSAYYDEYKTKTFFPHLFKQNGLTCCANSTIYIAVVMLGHILAFQFQSNPKILIRTVDWVAPVLRRLFSPFLQFRTARRGVLPLKSWESQQGFLVSILRAYRRSSPTGKIMGDFLCRDLIAIVASRIRRETILGPTRRAKHTKCLRLTHKY